MATTQEKLNQALEASGGEWTSEVNDLAKQRDAEKGQVWDASSQTYSSTNTNSGDKNSSSSNGIIGSVNAYAESHGLDNAQYSVNAEGKGVSTGGTHDASFWDAGKLLLYSITNPTEAAKLNPYWDAEKGVYDKTRDIDGDGLPDYDSAGNKISVPNEWLHQKGTFNIDEINSMGVGESFTIGHTTYKKNASGSLDKMNADGTVDHGGNDDGGSSDFDQVVQESEAQAEAYLSDNLSGKSYEDLIDMGYTETQARSIIDGTFALDPKASVTEQTQDIKMTEAEGTTLDPNADKFNVDLDQLNIDPNTAGNASQVTSPDQPDTATYDAKLTQDDIAGTKVETTKGKVGAEDLVDPEGYTIDMTGVATGVNKDGTVNETGIAIANYANQGITNVIDTSTISGQAAAEALGAGNYVDSKATVQGQIKILSDFFVDENGNTKIPPFAQGIAREVLKTCSMKGVTGTAAQAALASALMESMIPIASEDATFFQTITEKNLDNRQEAIINKAKVLAKFDEVNLNARETAAVQNAKHFFDMNLENLDIENEAAVLEFNAKVDSYFEDAKAINAERLFTAEETNDANQFWSELGVRCQEFNATAIDTMKRFNSGEINDMAEFNATMENEREKFYKDMQYAIEIANAKWRQTIETTNTKNKFDAAADDAQNMFDLTGESLTQIWDTVDSILENAWKAAENDKDRQNRIAVAQIQAASGRSSGGGFMSALGTIAGAFLGTTTGANWLVNLL